MELGRAARRSWELVVEQNYIDVGFIGPVMDPRWSFTDAAGHTHTPESRTWHRVQDDPTEPPFYFDGDGEEYNSPTHIECRECGEHLVPDVTSGSPFVESIPGSWSATLTGIRSDGRQVMVSLVLAEYESIRAAMAHGQTSEDDAVRSVLDNAPPQRVAWVRDPH